MNLNCKACRYFGDPEVLTEKMSAARVLAAKLQQAIKEIEWLCEGREDIDANGGPNLAMQIMQVIRQ